MSCAHVLTRVPTHLGSNVLRITSLTGIVAFDQFYQSFYMPQHFKIALNMFCIASPLPTNKTRQMEHGIN